MPLHTAVANNAPWDNTTTWDTGTVPGPNDDVELGGHTVRIWNGVEAEALSVKNTAGGSLDIRNEGVLTTPLVDGTGPGANQCVDVLRSGRLYVTEARSSVSRGVAVESGGYAEGSFYGDAMSHSCRDGAWIAGTFYGSDTTHNTYGLSLYRGFAIGHAKGGIEGHGIVNNNGTFMGTVETDSGLGKGVVAVSFSYNFITEQPNDNGSGRDTAQIYEDTLFWAKAGLDLSSVDFRFTGPVVLDDTWEIIAKLQQYFGGGGGGGPVGFPLSRIVQ